MVYVLINVLKVDFPKGRIKNKGSDKDCFLDCIIWDQQKKMRMEPMKGVIKILTKPHISLNQAKCT